MLSLLPLFYLFTKKLTKKAPPMRTASRKKLSILSNAIGLKTSSHNYFLFRLKGLKITLRPPTNKHTPKEIISASAPVFGRDFGFPAWDSWAGDATSIVFFESSLPPSLCGTLEGISLSGSFSISVEGRGICGLGVRSPMTLLALLRASSIAW